MELVLVEQRGGFLDDSRHGHKPDPKPADQESRLLEDTHGRRIDSIPFRKQAGNELRMTLGGGQVDGDINASKALHVRPKRIACKDRPYRDLLKNLIVMAKPL